MDLETVSDERLESTNLGLPGDPGQISPRNIFALIQRGAVSSDQRERVTSLGPFAELVWQPRDNWSVTLGARYDHFTFEVKDHLHGDGGDWDKRTMEQLSPMLAISHQFSDWFVYATLATGFQTPTTSELGNRPDGGGGFDPDLGPESTRSLELGLRGKLLTRSLSLQGATFSTRSKDMLSPFQNGDDDLVFFRNAGRVDREGAELALNWLPTSTFEAVLAAS